MSKFNKFVNWVATSREIKLHPWQYKIASMLLDKDRGTGKTELIKLLSDFNRNENNINNDGTEKD
jgi:hypothetical protein